MKIKMLKSLTLAAILLIAFGSCEKQLEEYNPSGLTSETVYSNAAGFEQRRAACFFRGHSRT